VEGNVQLHMFRLPRGAIPSADLAADGDSCGEYNAVTDFNNFAKRCSI